MRLLIFAFLMLASSSMAYWTCPLNSVNRKIQLTSTANSNDYNSWGNCLNDAISNAGKKNITVDLGTNTLWAMHTGDRIIIVGGENIIIRGVSPATEIRAGYSQPAFLEVKDSKNIQVEDISFFGTNLVLSGGQYGDAATVAHRAMHIESDTGLSANISVRNCRFYGFKTGGIVIGPRVENALIEGNIFNDVDHKACSSCANNGAIHIDRSKNISIIDNNYSSLYFSAVSLFASESILIDKDTAFFDLMSNYTVGVNCVGGLKAGTVKNSYYSGVKAEGVVISLLKSDTATGWIESGWNTISNNKIFTYGYGIAIHKDALFYSTPPATLSINNNKILDNNIYALGSGTDTLAFFGIKLNNSSNNLIQRNNIVDSSGRFNYGIEICEEFSGEISHANTIEGNYLKNIHEDAIISDNDVQLVWNTIENIRSDGSAIRFKSNSHSLVYRNTLINVPDGSEIQYESPFYNIFDFEN